MLETILLDMHMIEDVLGMPTEMIGSMLGTSYIGDMAVQ